MLRRILPPALTSASPRGGRWAMPGVRGLMVAAVAVVMAGVALVAVPGHLAGPDSESVAPPGTGASTRGATGLHPSRRFWTVTALGDSVVSGTNCACAPFVQRYAELAAQSTGVTVKVTNLGVPGLTSTGLTARLAGEPETRGSVAGSDIVLVTIGANDLAPALTQWQRDACNLSCFTQVLPTIGDNIGAAVQQIYRLRSGRATEILVTDYWNVFLDGQVAAARGSGYQQISDEVTRLANQMICQAATGAGAACVDLYTPFKGSGGTRDPTSLLADDGDHPDAAGHGLIAAALAAHGWAELGDREDAPGAAIR